MPEGYQTLSIPKQMYGNILEFIRDNPRLGYTSIPEFVKDAIRKNLGVQKPSEITKTPIENIPVGSPLEHSIHELYKLMNHPRYDPIRFKDVIQASTSTEVISFNTTTDKEFLEVLEWSLNNPTSPKTLSSSSAFVKDILTENLEKKGLRVESLAGGGYPDLEVKNMHGETIYITLKVLTKQNHKEFYYISSKKIREDAKHLLIEVDFNKEWDKGISHYCIRDLSTLALVLDVEFRASPKNIAKTTSLLAESLTRDRGQQYPA